MSKKDFILLAKVLAETKPVVIISLGQSDDALRQWRYMVEQINNALKETNPNYNERRFLSACSYFD